MPQFVMDKGTSAKDFNALDSFTQGYIEGVFFTERHADNPEIENCNFDDLAPETLATIISDCTDFQLENAEALNEATKIENVDYEDSRAGTDFWLTRNHHGAGFWDRGLGEVGNELSTEARNKGSRDLYLGDDEKLYLA